MQADSPLVTYVYEASNYGGVQDPNIVCVHDVEAPLDNGYARSLTGPNWFGGPAETSAHYVVGPDDICQGVPENRVAWHCGTGNPRSIAIEQCGYAAYSLPDWNTAKGLVQQENVSRLLADINRRRPTIRLQWLSNNELRTAWNNPGSPGGVVTHDQMRATFGGTTHHDPFTGPGQTVAYPLQKVIDRAVQIRNGAPTDWFDMASKEELQQIIRDEVGTRLAQLDPVIRETYNRSEWINVRTEPWDSVIRQTYNFGSWTNTRTEQIQARLESLLNDFAAAVWSFKVGDDDRGRFPANDVVNEMSWRIYALIDALNNPGGQT